MILSLSGLCSGGVVKRFIPFGFDQPLLLPPDCRDALPAGHTALLLDLVEALDLSEVHAGIAEEQCDARRGALARPR